MGNSILKVPGGKLLKISLTGADSIESIEIRGDFFAHPESIVEKIESVLVGVSIAKEVLVQTIKKTVEQEQAELYGIDPESISEAILMAVEKEEEE